MSDDAPRAEPWWTRLRGNVRLLALGARLTWDAHRTLTVLLLVIMVVEAVLAPIQLVIAAIAVDSLVHEVSASAAVSSWAARYPPGIWIALLVVTILFGQLMGPLRSFVQSLLADRATLHVGDHLLAATNRWHGVARFEDPATADDLALASSRAANAGNQLLTQAGPFFPDLFTCITLGLTLGTIHPLLPVALVLASVPHMLAIYAFSDRVFSHLAWQTPESRRLLDTRDMPLRPDLARDVHLFDLGDRLHERYDRIWNATTASLDTVRQRLLVRQVAATALKHGVVGAAVLLVVWRATEGQLSAGEVTLFIGAIFMLAARLTDLGSRIGYLPRVLAFLPSLQRVLDAPVDMPLPAEPARLVLPLTSGLAFHGVSFAYPGSDRPVLRDVSFTLAPGERVALVGHNGAGKTTIVKLMLRLYDPDDGVITLDGVDVRRYDPTEMRRAFGVIFQDFGRYDVTARENIGLGDVGCPHDDDDLLRAAGKAGADGVVSKLPEGLDTMLGLRFGSRDLSGGEWQKIALARAFLRDAPILVLDEPTAALDVRAEHEVYERFGDLTRDRATMLISHRFSTVRMADRILVLDDARIAEQGTHEALMARRGIYHHLYTAQARHYVEKPAR